MSTSSLDGYIDVLDDLLMRRVEPPQDNQWTSVRWSIVTAGI